MGRVGSCSRCCIGLSVPGVIFLCIVGFMFDHQGFYVSLDFEDESGEQYWSDAASSCYMAAVIYVIAIALSVVGIWYEKRQPKASPRSGATAGEAAYGDESTELLGSSDSDYGALTNLSQMPLMPRGYSRND